MVDWKPYTGRYPKDDAQWNTEFEKYKQCSEYKNRASEFTLENFKPIYKI
jgi:heme A synthase